MKLLRLKADGFGLLRGEWHFDPARLNLVIDENERGKTSLLHAIVAGLYGLDGDARRHRGTITPLERWRPWDGGTYRLELDIESDGEKYTISRDFARGSVEVFNDRGQDVTPDFATEKDGFSIGLPLLGLDADEFAKCAFWRQGELADVVPELEKDRRASTLQARLESAADTRAGDASAIEAIQALEASLKAFDSPVLGTTLTIENAVKRLQGMREFETTQIRSFEHAYAEVAGPLERIATLDEEELALRARLRALEAHGATLRAGDATQRLERDDQRRTELAQRRAEAEALAPLANIPADAESVLSAQTARHSDLATRVKGAEAKRRAIEPELARMDAALEQFGAYEEHTAEDADALAVRAGELRRLEEERARIAHELEDALQAVRAQGLDPDRATILLPRFEALTLEQGDLLRDQPRIALTQQTELAMADQTRSMGRTMLRDIGQWKQPRYIVGGALAALGLAGTAVALATELVIPRPVAIIAGVAVMVAGGVVLIATAYARRKARDEAHERIHEADELQRQSQLRNIENDRLLQTAATELGYGTPQALLDEWAEAQRLKDLASPVHAAEQQRMAIERQYGAVQTAARALLAGTHEEVTPDALEDAATQVRQRLALEQDRAGIVRRLELADAEANEAQVAAQEMEQQAVSTIRAAGLNYEPGGSWTAWVGEVGQQVRRSLRRVALLEREIPAIEAELFDDATRAALGAERERATAATAGLSATERAAVQGATSPAEAEALSMTTRARLEALRDERETLRRDVQNVADRYHAEHPGACARLETAERELARAQTFRDSVTYARESIERVAAETHRRWAEFLNERVSNLLKDVGSSISRVRFGEDLDFAVSLASGHQATRGKAVHQLSSGARDQLHLAVRLAITEFLSRGGESMPLLIDDCFATSDDDRTRHGLKVLLDMFSRQHQIVFVTCHRARHESLAEQDAALYAERVHWLELRARVASGA